MQNLFKEYGLIIENEKIEIFKKFLDIFITQNSITNLSAIRDEIWIIQKHFIDSLILTNFENLSWKILDLWSWWWFPWIPLKIFFWDKTDFLLVDSVWKKVNCMNLFIKQLWLTQISWLQARAEELWQNNIYRENFDFVVSRAMAYFPTLLEYSLPLLKIWWTFIAYKQENILEIKDWEKALKELWWKIEKIEEYDFLWAKRQLIFVKKVSKTPQKYPRKIWEPLKNPIL